MSIKSTIVHIIKCSLDKLEVSNQIIEERDIIVEIPAKKENGNYSTNIALVLAKKLHKSPIEIAEAITKNISRDDMIKEIKIASPGFINFFLKTDYLLTQINTIIEII